MNTIEKWMLGGWKEDLGNKQEFEDTKESEGLSDCCGAKLDISKAFCSDCGEHV